MQCRKSVIITGGTVNLGYQAALVIAKAHPDYLVVLCSRTDNDHAAEKINKLLSQKNTIYIPIDLANTASVRQFATQWAADERPPIQSLLLNAGLQFPGPLKKTNEGLEATFAINHVGNVLLFHLIYPFLDKGARVVVTSSGTHDPAQKTGLPDAKYTSAKDLAYPPADMVNIPGRQRYASSKLANVLWTYALDRRISELGLPLTANAFEPGLMPGTGLAREGNPILRFIWLHLLPHMLPLLRLLIGAGVHSPVESGAALAELAIGRDVEGKSGLYFDGFKPFESSKDSHDRAKQEDLWEWTIEYLARSEEEREVFHLRRSSSVVASRRQ